MELTSRQGSAVCAAQTTARRGCTLRISWLAFAFLFFVASELFATLATDLTDAVTAGGARSVAEASPEQFLRAFNSIAVRAPERDLAMDVAAGVQLRPDLAERIVVSVLEIGQRDGKLAHKPFSCELIARIIRAAVGAAPEAAPAIVRAAVHAEPDARNCIIAAAIKAAPDQEFAIRAAAGEGTMTTLVQWHGTGTINPADFTEVNSPEKPPATP